MNVDGVAYRSIWTTDAPGVRIIDQSCLPFAWRIAELHSPRDMVEAIAGMQVRGAPLIGVAAAYGMALAASADPADGALAAAAEALARSRPTAVNLAWALERMRRRLAGLPPGQRAAAAWALAGEMAEEDVRINRAIGEHGAPLLAALQAPLGRPLQVLTHCNAGWLATVDGGTALAPVYRAHDAGVPLHLWVDETRPRNQGLLTAWELAAHGVPNTLVADNAGGHLMQRGQVDLVLVGADRVSAAGDVCNKIGTLLKALAARAHGLPFYVAVPSPTIDWGLGDALAGIPIEERPGDELRRVRGLDEDGRVRELRLAGEQQAVANPAFDLTPAALVSGLITEHGVLAPAALSSLRPGLRVAQEAA